MKQTDFNPLEIELDYVTKNFDLNKVLTFVKPYELVLYDYGHYAFVVKDKIYATGFTPMYTLLRGIENYNDNDWPRR